MILCLAGISLVAWKLWPPAASKMAVVEANDDHNLMCDAGMSDAKMRQDRNCLGTGR